MSHRSLRLPPSLSWRLLALAATVLVLLALGLTGAPPARAAEPGATVVTPHVRAELLAHAPQGVGPGQPLWLGLRIEHQPQWHTYWKNPGDSGLPILLNWTLPPGLSAGEIGWPLPKAIPVGPLVNFGYEGTVVLPVPVQVSTDFRPPALGDAVDIRLHASWLVCRSECIPEEGRFTLRLPLRGSTALHGAAFDAAQAAQPRPIDDGARQRSSARPDGALVQLRVAGLPAAWQGQRLALLPETADLFEHGTLAGTAWKQAWEGGVWTASVPVSPQRGASPAMLPVVLALGGEGRSAALPVQGAWPATAAPATVSPALEAALRENARAATAPTVGAWGLAGALLGALLGGLLLNLMPCVFPVLAIKVLAFARHADDQRAHRLSGLAYTGGVVVGFLALGLLLLALRSAGESLGWGFQLQNPWVVAGLAALFTVIGLNLAGVFEFGHVLPSGLAGLQLRHPVADAALTGLLAVAVASPCTAPFMGASLGLAIGLPAPQALAVFATLGLGLALPYLVAAFVPAVARALPRPGAWMDRLRRFLAFPMFATVVWLVWVLGQQSGIDGAASLLALLVALAWVLWSLQLAGRTRWVSLTAASAMAVWLAVGLGPSIGAPAAAAGAVQAGPATERWRPWSEAVVREHLARGEPVFIDFTAAWCVTCQYNKKTVLADPDVLARFEARRVQLLRADWTRRDPAITAALAALGRSGVPVYVLHAPGRAPQVLSELPSADEVRQALDRL